MLNKFPQMKTSSSVIQNLVFFQWLMLEPTQTGERLHSTLLCSVLTVFQIPVLHHNRCHKLGEFRTSSFPGWLTDAFISWTESM
jgi:hypothetical protein